MICQATQFPSPSVLLQRVPPKRTNISTKTAAPGWSDKPVWQAPRANPSSKGTSLISRLPLHYIILLDQEFLSVETWCGFWYESYKETLQKRRKLDWIFADAGALRKTSQVSGMKLACRNSCIQLLSFILTPLCTAIVQSTTVLLLLRRTENSSRAFAMHLQYKINVTVYTCRHATSIIWVQEY